MQLYRSTIKSQGGEGDYSSTYTYLIGGVKGKGSCYGMFQDETTFNSPVIIGKNVISCSSMFKNSAFNQPIVIPNNVINTAHMFADSAFNQPIVIPNNVNDTMYMFANSVFNHPIAIPSNCNCPYMLRNTPFNSNIVIGDNCALDLMLIYCHEYNQNLQIPDSTRSCSGLFHNCVRFNQNIKIPSNIKSMMSMFESTAMNQNITIPSNVNDISRMLFNTPFGRNIYIKGNVYRNITVYKLFNSSTKRKNIWFHSSLNNVFNNAFIVGSDDDTEGLIPTWTSMTNGFYNTQFNIYCYYNYAG